MNMEDSGLGDEELTPTLACKAKPEYHDKNIDNLLADKTTPSCETLKKNKGLILAILSYFMFCPSCLGVAYLSAEVKTKVCAAGHSSNNKFSADFENSFLLLAPKHLS